ncbi:hypothetical protein [Kitasatospora purpeofusca]|uniref:hypothetical protein n=1 Tax=Kitasatospora purpeofusca TaxID=67352 RepID=UPI00367617E7
MDLRRSGGWAGVRAALVRPDGHLARVGTEQDGAALVAAATAAGRGWGRASSPGGRSGPVSEV